MSCILLHHPNPSYLLILPLQLSYCHIMPKLCWNISSNNKIFPFLYGYTFPLNALIFIYINTYFNISNTPFPFTVLHGLSELLILDILRLSRHISFIDTFKYCFKHWFIYQPSILTFMIFGSMTCICFLPPFLQSLCLVQ